MKQAESLEPQGILSSEFTDLYKRLNFLSAIGFITGGVFTTLSAFGWLGWWGLLGLIGIIIGIIWVRGWKRYIRPATHVVMDEESLVYEEGLNKRRVPFYAIESIRAAPWFKQPTMIITYREDSGSSQQVMFFPKFMGFSLTPSFDRIHALLESKREEQRQKHVTSAQDKTTSPRLPAP